MALGMRLLRLPRLSNKFPRVKRGVAQNALALRNKSIIFCLINSGISEVDEFNRNLCKLRFCESSVNLSRFKPPSRIA